MLQPQRYRADLNFYYRIYGSPIAFSQRGICPELPAGRGLRRR